MAEALFIIQNELDFDGFREQTPSNASQGSRVPTFFLTRQGPSQVGPCFTIFCLALCPA
jgi:hypothetical protein